MRTHIITTLILGLLISNSPLQASRLYEPIHGESVIQFDIKHLAQGVISGRFRASEIQLRGNPLSDPNAQVTCTINVNSLDTKNRSRDRHLKSNDFFDLSRYPVITFNSDTIVPSTSGYIAKGHLGIKGNRLPLSIPFQVQKNSATHLHITAQVPINRFEAGITTYRRLIQPTANIQLLLVLREAPATQ